MKTTRITYAIFLLFFASYAFAQPCSIPNGSFESWEDLTSEFDESGILPPGTIELPEGYIGFFRLFFSSFLDLFEVLSGEELIEASTDFFGLYQFSDATAGDFSMQMLPNEEFPFVDAFTAFECGGELASSFCFDVKHVGDISDTLTILGIFDEGANLSSDEEDLMDVSGYFIVDNVILSGDSDWTTYNIPIIDNMNGVSPDTAVLFLYMASDQNLLSAGEESYFLIDNMHFKSDGVLDLDNSSLAVIHENNYNRLSWTGMTSPNLSHYEVERSYEELGDWESINKIPIDFQSDTDYGYIDKDIARSGTYYYRIKQIDHNGSASLSTIVAVSVPIVASLSITTYPNPAVDIMNLDIHLRDDVDQLSYQLHSLEGKQFEFGAHLPKSLIKGYHNFPINVSDLPAGIYNLLIDTEYSEVKERVVIAK